MSTDTETKPEAKALAVPQVAQAPLALRGDTFDELFRQAKALSPSSLIPKHLRGATAAETMANVTLVLAQGRELGLGPVASLSGIAVVNGRPFTESKTLAAVVRASGLCKSLRCVEQSDKAVTWETWRHGEPEPERRTFTMDMAKTAGLASRDTYKAHPQRMLSARALGWLLNDVYPECTKGVGTEADREDAVYREAPVDPPAVGVAGLKTTLLKRKGEPPEEAVVEDRAALPLTHPDAEPPIDVVLPGQRQPGEEG